MKNSQAIFVHTNGYDLIFLENGTYFQVENQSFDDFANAEKNNDDFTGWDSNEHWTDFADDIEDEYLWNNRKDFYGIED